MRYVDGTDLAAAPPREPTRPGAGRLDRRPDRRRARPGAAFGLVHATSSRATCCSHNAPGATTPISRTSASPGEPATRPDPDRRRPRIGRLHRARAGARRRRRRPRGHLPLACILFQMPTGRWSSRPRHRSREAVGARPRPARRLAGLNPDLPAGLQDVLDRALAKTPATASSPRHSWRRTPPTRSRTLIAGPFVSLLPAPRLDLPGGLVTRPLPASSPGSAEGELGQATVEQRQHVGR